MYRIRFKKGLLSDYYVVEAKQSMFEWIILESFTHFSDAEIWLKDYIKNKSSTYITYDRHGNVEYKV